MRTFTKERSQDIFFMDLQSVWHVKRHLCQTGQRTVGFAAETQNLLANAREKVVKKNLDMIVANDVTAAGAGFNSDTNIVKFLYANGDVCELEQMPKVDVANRILDEALRIRRERV